MNSQLQEYIAERRVDGALRERLESLTPERSHAFLLLIDALTPSANTLRELLRVIDDICGRDNIDLPELIGREDLQAVLSDDSLGRKEKQRELRLLLERIRFPVMTEVEAELETCKKQIAKELGLKIELPKDLEGDSVTLRVTAREESDFLVAAGKLSALAAHTGMKKIFSILKGEF